MDHDPDFHNACKQKAVERSGISRVALLAMTLLTKASPAAVSSRVDRSSLDDVWCFLSAKPGVLGHR